MVDEVNERGQSSKARELFCGFIVIVHAVVVFTPLLLSC